MNTSEVDRLTAFLGSLLNGAADLGLTALPMLKLYQRAKEEKLDFWMLVLTDPSTADALSKALEKHAAKVSPRLIAAMKLVVQAHGDAALRQKQQAEAVNKAKAEATEPDV